MKARGNRRNSRGYIPHDDKRDIQPDKIAGVIMSNAVFNWALSPGPEDHWRTCKDTVYDIRPQICRRNPEWCQDNRRLNEEVARNIPGLCAVHKSAFGASVRRYLYLNGVVSRTKVVTTIS